VIGIVKKSDAIELEESSFYHLKSALRFLAQLDLTVVARMLDYEGE
jgi:hypothetical protein